MEANGRNLLHEVMRNTMLVLRQMGVLSLYAVLSSTKLGLSLPIITSSRMASKGGEDHEMAQLEMNRYEVEDNAVFIDYQKVQLLKNIDSLGCLNFYQRFALAKNLDSIREVLGLSSAYFKLLMALSRDSDEIQTQVVGWLGCRWEKEGGGELEEVREEYIQPLKRLIEMGYLQTKEDSSVLLSKIVHKASSEDIRDTIKYAKKLEGSDSQECRLAAVQLLALLSQDMPPNEAQQYFMVDYLDLFKAGNVRIKKKVIHYCPAVAKHVSEPFRSEQIVDRFILSNSQEVVWGLRRACVDVMASMIELAPERKEALAAAMYRLTKDTNKLVRLEALNALPCFLAKYQHPNIMKQLVETYVKLHTMEEFGPTQQQILWKISYYFPGVLKTTGPSQWITLRPLFQKLLKVKPTELKIPIASSLHQINKILAGTPEHDTEMVNALCELIGNDLNCDSVRSEIISHFAAFAKPLEERTRERLIDVLINIMRETKKWRRRFEMAAQMGDLSKLYNPDTVFRFIFPTCLKLCNDSIAEVRCEAAKHIRPIIEVTEKTEYEGMVLDTICGYGLSEQCVQRQIFARMIRYLHPLPTFMQKAYKIMTNLASDSIMNARIALARSVRKIIREEPEEREKFREVIEIMSRDDPDVSQYFK